MFLFRCNFSCCDGRIGIKTTPFVCFCRVVVVVVNSIAIDLVVIVFKTNCKLQMFRSKLLLLLDRRSAAFREADSTHHNRISRRVDDAEEPIP